MRLCAPRLPRAVRSAATRAVAALSAPARSQRRPVCAAVCRTRVADLSKSGDADAVVRLTNLYATDPCGGRDGEPLADEHLQALVPAMRAHGHVFVVLAEDGSEAIGHATCVMSFSTFKVGPVLNVHDLHVVASHRKQGVGRLLLEAAMEEGRRRGATKATLEVLTHNAGAERLYRDLGFEFGTSAMHTFITRALGWILTACRRIATCALSLSHGRNEVRGTRAVEHPGARARADSEMYNMYHIHRAPPRKHTCATQRATVRGASNIQPSSSTSRKFFRSSRRFSCSSTDCDGATARNSRGPSASSTCVPHMLA